MIHRLAILSLLLVAAMNINNSFRQSPGAPAVVSLAPMIGIAIWGWLLWKIWTRPRNWGLGVGIFLFLLIPFQSYLWWLAVNSPDRHTLGSAQSAAVFLLLHQLPNLVAAVSCTLLRFYYPNESAGSAKNK